MKNSREEDIKMIEILKNKNLYINIKPKSSICIDCINKNKNKHIEAEVVINEKLEEAINYTLSDYKRVLKENEELKLYNNSITSQLEQMTTEKFKEGWIHQSEFKDFIPVQKVKDKIRKNEEIIDISNDGDLIHELLHENKVYEELLESEE